MSVSYKGFDDGIIEFTLKNNDRMTVKVINIGCSITEILVPDNTGRSSNVVLRYDTLGEYFRNKYFLGAVVAPVAGRVEDAEFEIGDGKYSFAPNEGENLLHSGNLNLYNKIWKSDVEGDKVIFQYKMGDEFPGAPLIKVIYSLNDENELKLEYEIRSDAPSVVAPTNHTYFNLSNESTGDVGGHSIKSKAGHYMKMDQELIPKSVEKCDGIFDLGHGRRFKEVFESDDDQIRIANGGFDHYFIFDKGGRSVEVTEEESGRTLSVTTTSPGMVLYTGNNLDEKTGLQDRKSQKYAGFCLETQESPAALKMPIDHDVRMKEDDIYRRETVFSFGLKK